MRKQEKDEKNPETAILAWTIRIYWIQERKWVNEVKEEKDYPLVDLRNK